MRGDLCIRILVLPSLVLGWWLLAQPPAAIGDSEAAYSDVVPDNWFYGHINQLADQDIFAGTDCEEGQFCPRDPLERWQVAVWLVRAFDQEGGAEPESPVRFDDVDSDLWWAPMAERLAELEITVGCASDPPLYCPDKSVSRSQVASFLSRALDLPEADPIDWADVDRESNSHVANIDRLYAAGITAGCSSRDGVLRYCPDMPIPKYQIAVMIHRALDWQESQETEDEDQETDSSSGGGSGSSLGSSSSSSSGPGPGSNSRQVIIGAPRSVSVKAVNREALSVIWRVPTGGNEEVSGYLIQWRLSDESFSSAKQQAVSATGDPADLNPSADWFMIPLPDHDSYQIRVTAVFNDGQTTMAEALSPFSAAELWRLINDELVAVYSPSHPWLKVAWGYANNRPDFLIGTYAPNRLETASVLPDFANGSPLNRIEIVGLRVRSDIIRGSYLYVYAHELAHIYTMHNDLADRPGPLAIATLYFQDLINKSGTAEPQFCYPTELYADTAEFLLELRDEDQHYIQTYWESDDGDCTGGATAPTAEAKQVVRQALAGQMPQWLYDNFTTGADSVDLEALWRLVQSIHNQYIDAAIVVYQLRSEFGGYCNPAQVNGSSRREQVRNPWRDGGCVPEAPTNLELTPGDGQLSVSWQPPAYDGGRDLTGYVVQWKTDDQDYGSDRQLAAGPEQTSADIGSLTNGASYSVRVIAGNGHDDGDDQTINDGWGPPAPASSSPQSADNTPPSSPGTPTASVNNGVVTLVWTAPDTGTVTGYQILRRQLGEETSMSAVADSVNGLTWVDANVQSGERYAYRVKARNGAVL